MRLSTLPLLAALIALLAAPVVANADDKAPDKTTDKTTDKSTDKPAKIADADMKILAHEHAVNQTEIDMGKLAQQRGSSAAVKAYGATLVADHQSADKDAQAFAKKRGQTIPKDVQATDAEKADHKDMMDKMAKLRTLRGPEFDRMFLQISVDAHDKEVAKAGTAINVVADPDLKILLTSVTPVLQRHADQARELQKATPTS